MYDCDKCPATFLHRYSLTRHVLAHTDIRFECKLCKTQFKYKTNLKRHEKNTHRIKHDRRQRSTTYNVIRPADAGPSIARDWVDLTGNSDNEDEPSYGERNQVSVTNDAINLQPPDNQGAVIRVPSNKMKTLKSECIDQSNALSYTCNVNSNVCLCGFCTTVDIKTEDEINNTNVENPPTDCKVIDSTVAERMTIESTSSQVKPVRKIIKRNSSINTPLKLSDLDSHKFPEQRYKMAKEYIVEQHKKIKSYEKTIKDLENCIGIMNDELIRYKTEFKKRNL